jgi:hypothetical protein
MKLKARKGKWQKMIDKILQYLNQVKSLRVLGWGESQRKAFILVSTSFSRTYNYISLFSSHEPYELLMTYFIGQVP